MLIYQEVLKDKCLCPRGGCRAPEALGALAVVQEDQANEGPCRLGYGVMLSCQVRLSPSGCCCHWTRYLGMPGLGIPATIRRPQSHREPEEKGHLVLPCLFHTAMVRPGQHADGQLVAPQEQLWGPGTCGSLASVLSGLGTGDIAYLNGGTGAQGTLPWLSPSCSNLAPYTVPPTGQGPPSWSQKLLPSSLSVQHKKQMVPKVSPSLTSMSSCKCYASKLLPRGPAKWSPLGDTSLTPPC